MAVYIDSSGRLHHDQESGLALNCPHCGVLAHVTPVSVPDFNALQQHKPSQVGLVYRCAACNAPVFLRFTVKLYGEGKQVNRVDKPLPKGEVLTIGGDAKDNNAWLITVRPDNSESKAIDKAQEPAIAKPAK